MDTALLKDLQQLLSDLGPSLTNIALAYILMKYITPFVFYTIIARTVLKVVTIVSQGRTDRLKIELEYGCKTWTTKVS